MNNQFTKKEAPIQGFAGMGGGAFSRLLTSAASGGNRSLRFNPADSPTLAKTFAQAGDRRTCCLLYTSPSPRDRTRSRMPSSA